MGTATTAGRRGRRPPRLTLRLPLRPIPGCCTVATDCPTVGTTATATTTLPTLTSEAAATTSADLSLALEDKREASYQQKPLHTLQCEGDCPATGTLCDSSDGFI